MSNILNDLCDNLAEKSQQKAADMAADVAVKAAGAAISGVNNQLNEWSGKDLYEICQFHAIGAATAATASGVIPGAGEAIALAADVGFIVSMYVRISKKSCERNYRDHR